MSQPQISQTSTVNKKSKLEELVEKEKISQALIK